MNREFKNVIYWLKATNGSGKSTFPFYMLENSTDEEIEYIYDSSEKPKVIATIFKKFNMASVGPYVRGKTFGGCDSLKKPQILEALEKLKPLNYDVFVEGILTGAGTLGTGKARTGDSYYDILKSYPRSNRYYLFIESEWINIVNRIKARTGKTDEDIDSLKTVMTKYEDCRKHKLTYELLNEIKCLSVENNGTKQEFIDKFKEL